MLSIILGAMTVAVLALGFLVGITSDRSHEYGSQLEKFILSKNPQNTADVERYTIEFHRAFDKGFL